MPEYTSKKMAELAVFVVETMDQEQLVEMAYQYIIEGYEVNEEGFHEDWHTYFGFDDEDSDHPDKRLFKHEEGY
jgi:hypothetical protein